MVARLSPAASRAVRLLVAVAALAPLLALAPAVRAQSDTSPIFVAHRVYDSADGRLNFTLATFKSAEAAKAAMPLVLSGLADDSIFGQLKETAAEPFRDQDAARDGTARTSFGPMRIGVLLVRDGKDLHGWVALGPSGGGVPRMTAIAHQVFDHSRLPAPPGSTEEQQALSRLPNASEVPNGFALYDEGIS